MTRWLFYYFDLACWRFDNLHQEYYLSSRSLPSPTWWWRLTTVGDELWIENHFLICQLLMVKRWNGCVENAGQEAKASTTHQHIHQAVPVSWFPASRLHLGPTYLVDWFFSLETMHPLLWRLVVWKPVAKSFAERWQLLYLLTLLDFMAIIVLKSSVKSDSLAEYCWRLRCLKFCLQSAVNSNIA